MGAAAHSQATRDRNFPRLSGRSWVEGEGQGMAVDWAPAAFPRCPCPHSGCRLLWREGSRLRQHCGLDTTSRGITYYAQQTCSLVHSFVYSSFTCSLSRSADICEVPALC